MGGGRRELLTGFQRGGIVNIATLRAVDELGDCLQIGSYDIREGNAVRIFFLGTVKERHHDSPERDNFMIAPRQTESQGYLRSSEEFGGIKKAKAANTQIYGAHALQFFFA